jgi:hypothetical protein
LHSLLNSFNLDAVFCRRDVRAVEGARLESVYTFIAYRGFESLSLRVKLLIKLIIASIGPSVTLGREPRQVRKEATVAADASA